MKKKEVENLVTHSLSVSRCKEIKKEKYCCFALSAAIVIIFFFSIYFLSVKFCETYTDKASILFCLLQAICRGAKNLKKKNPWKLRILDEGLTLIYATMRLNDTHSMNGFISLSSYVCTKIVKQFVFLV